MPPGWSHTGDHKTASKVKKEYLQNPQPAIAAEARETPVLDGTEASVA
jgi:hypothetical protein